ncbi:MAG: dihydrofolate reductase, partial [Muribaculaceae bacterium]|nr:dihydrofolate reductase [Muribaculaceae bacterium]
MVNIIVAATLDGAIGLEGDMLYYIGPDLKRFRELTTGNTIIMGRKTFESLPKGALPDRRNIVVTRQSAFAAPGAETAGSLEEALAMAAGQEIFIIGGESIYRQAMP